MAAWPSFFAHKSGPFPGIISLVCSLAWVSFSFQERAAIFLPELRQCHLSQGSQRPSGGEAPIRIAFLILPGLGLSVY